MHELTQYTAPMPRGPKPNPANVKKTVGLKVHPTIKTEFNRILEELKKTSAGRVTEAGIAEKLFLRGLEAYRIDKKLVGPAKLSKKARPVLPGTASKLEAQKKKKGNDDNK
jgi:hypothetical protein